MSELSALPMRDDLPEHFRPVSVEFYGDMVRVEFPNGRVDTIPDWQYAAWFTKKAP